MDKKKKQHNIYKTTNLINGKFYWGVHNSDDENDGYLGSGDLLLKAIDKYGKENFRRETKFLYETSKEAYNDEALIINDEMIKDKINCYNRSLGGRGGFLSKEINDKNTLSRIGKSLSKETKLKISSSLKGKNSSMYGKRNLFLSEKNKINNGMLGKKHSDSSKRKMSEARKKYWNDRRASNLR